MASAEPARLPKKEKPQAVYAAKADVLRARYRCDYWKRVLRATLSKWP